MSVVNVYIPTPFRDLTGGLGHVQGDGATIGALIANLEQRYPGLAAAHREGETVRLHVNVFVNGQEMRCLSREATSLSPGDEIAFIPALVGGCHSLCRTPNANNATNNFHLERTRTS